MHCRIILDMVRESLGVDGMGNRIAGWMEEDADGRASSGRVFKISLELRG